MNLVHASPSGTVEQLLMVGRGLEYVFSIQNSIEKAGIVLVFMITVVGCLLDKYAGYSS